MHEVSSQQASEFVAPARVNLLGEHTDYTGGLVLPMAIPFSTVAAVEPRSDGRYRFTSDGFPQVREMDAADRSEARHDWSDYAVGVLRQLQLRGIEPAGFNLHVSGNVPFGAGLSSSASVEVACAMALLDRAGAKLPAEEIAVLCRAAENDYVHSPCGIMDQFVITAAKAAHALLLDTGSLEYEHIPMDRGTIADTVVIVCNSMVKHSVATGEYGVRHREVMEGQAAVLAAFPQLADLGDATLEHLKVCETKMSHEAFLRCRHIISDNGRVRQAKQAMLDGDAQRLGQLMLEGHVSERDDFQCSVEEVDFLVETAAGLQGCFGARLTGGGFGGCTVNLVAKDASESFVADLTKAYRERFGIDAPAWVCGAVDGAMLRNAASEVEA
ncbi:MAG: galactokinase [Acidobacteriota bacterium]